MDETAIAFELPHARAAATDGGRPLDRISVRDYTRQVEIGAFRTERGVTQRIRFNVVLEVAPHTAAQDDDVDKVVSYDTITEAIEEEIAAERINLLETLAERVAARVPRRPSGGAGVRAPGEARPHPRRARRRDRAQPAARGRGAAAARYRPRRGRARRRGWSIWRHRSSANPGGGMRWRRSAGRSWSASALRFRSRRRRRRRSGGSGCSPSSRRPGRWPTPTRASRSPGRAPSSTGR